MNRVSIYKHLETNEELKLLKVGKYYHDQSGKVYQRKRLSVCISFAAMKMQDLQKQGALQV